MNFTASQKKQLVPVVLFLANLFYLYIGGCIFRAIEEHPVIQPKTSHEVEELLELLKESNAGKLLPGDFNSKEIVSRLSDDELGKIDGNLAAINHERSLASKPKWSFSNAMFFATTIVTTIGYGNLAPVTTGGRMFCIIYALIGIPLTLMLLAVVSTVIVQKLNDACAYVVGYIRKNFYKGYEFEAASGEINAPVWLALPIIFVFLTLMSSVYCALEGWDFGTSLYFIFITFTTIGFGDVVPKSRAGIWINTTLLYVGLSVVSITINLCATGVARQMQKTGKYIKILQFFSVDDDDTPEHDGASAGHGTEGTERGNDSDRFEMQTLEDEEENSRTRVMLAGDDETGTKLNITRDSTGRCYGSVQE
ncbi:TWiK family of potassium channels protein 7 isoform X2 [Nematostella vectensis]|uniref:TWiK family of potassium channels protein 7 isoform X2 n=1 Tax=Nematostella vectensis TaxID=45351 RepID=UPI00207744B7|nr:TWiK family of potassium channels protein 7 isoform X2 [Nematostella vectensis]